MGEHLPCKQGVRSSTLLISTNEAKKKRIEPKVSIAERLKESNSERHEWLSKTVW